MKVLIDLNKKGKTVILITHDWRIADFADRTIRILDGKIEKGPSTKAQGQGGK